MKIFHLVYINSRWNEVVKQFDNMEKALEFVVILDKRIERGTCHGYVLSDFDI